MSSALKVGVDIGQRINGRRRVTMSKWVSLDWIKTNRVKVNGKNNGFVNMRYIYSAPFIEIVRCNDCSHFNKDTGLHYCKLSKLQKNPEDFCSDGIPKNICEED